MAEEVVGFTKSQREWILERDGNQCQMFFYRNGKWQQCPNRSNLQVHHIIPRGWSREHMPKDFPVNGSQNGICLCRVCHVAKFGVHPDTYEALMEYHKGDKKAYVRMMEMRRELNMQGIPYWNTRFDWLFNRRVKKNNLRMLRKKKYPTNGNRGNNGRRKTHVKEAKD